MKSLKLMATAVMFTLALFSGESLCAENQTDRSLLIDVRTESEWKEGHLEGAILIPYDRIEEGIAKVAPGRERQISLYCRTGRRSGIALDTLKKLGYGHVTNYGSLQSASEKLKIPVVK